MDSGIAAHIADRIDAHDSLVKERDELKAEVERLRVAASQDLTWLGNMPRSIGVEVADV